MWQKALNSCLYLNNLTTFCTNGTSSSVYISLKIYIAGFDNSKLTPKNSCAEEQLWTAGTGLGGKHMNNAPSEHFGGRFEVV